MDIAIHVAEIIVAAFLFVWSIGISILAVQSDTNKERQLYWLLAVFVAALAIVVGTL